MEEENANYLKVLDDLKANFGKTVAPFYFPILDGDKFIICQSNALSQELKNKYPDAIISKHLDMHYFLTVSGNVLLTPLEISSSGYCP